MLPETQFPFLAEKGHVVSLVGGGGKTTLLYHCRDQNGTKSCYSSRTGTGDCSKETGNNDTYDRDATFFVSDTGIYKINQSV